MPIVKPYENVPLVIYYNIDQEYILKGEDDYAKENRIICWQ